MSTPYEEERDRRLENVLTRMADSVADSSRKMTTSIAEIQAQMETLREQRYKPYVASIGLFVVITLSVTGYVYNLESRITTALFEMSNRMGNNEGAIRVNAEGLLTQEKRSLARQEHTREREEAIRVDIETLQENHSSLAIKTVEHFEGHSKK